MALESLKIPQSPAQRSPKSIPGSHDGSRSSSRASAGPSKLRYAAYDAPKPTPRMRMRRASSSSSRSDTSSYHDPDESLSKTVTAGDLALASGRKDLQELSTVCIHCEQISKTTTLTLNSPQYSLQLLLPFRLPLLTTWFVSPP